MSSTISWARAILEMFVRFTESLLSWAWRKNSGAGSGVLSAEMSLIRRWIRSHPTATYVDPQAFSNEIGMEPRVVLAALQEMQNRGEGEYAVVVRDSDGGVVARFPSFKSVPSRVEDEFGDEIEASRSNTDLIFAFAGR